MSDSAAFDRQARALEGIERHAHDMVKIFTDISKTLDSFHETVKETLDALDSSKKATDVEGNDTKGGN
jgi:hypothetical protein